jgi:hypothetical protein
MQEPFDWEILGDATGHYARGHLDIIVTATPWGPQSSFTSLTDNQIAREYE